MKKLIRQLCACIVLLNTQESFSHNLSLFTHGHGGFIYDAFPLDGPLANPSSNPTTNHPGFWSTQIEAFNTAPVKNPLTRLYVYGTSIDTGGKTNTVNYNNSFAIDSVAAYRKNFPDLTILAIVDGTPGQLIQSDASTIQLAQDLATSLANQVCADPNVNGVFFDIEPTKFSYKGLATLYQTTANLLAACDRYMGVYAYVTTGDGHLVKPVLGNNGFLAVPLYDVQDSQPPTPTNLSLYGTSVKSYISNTDANSKLYHIPYTVIGPAAASFGEFEQYGTYAPPPPVLPAPYNFTLIQNFSPNITQVLYMTTVNANTIQYAQSPYYMGVDYWGWNYFISPIPKENQLLLPSYPDENTVSYLKNNAF
jgi:hypothetical protein